MSKTKWRNKSIYVAVALALCLGLSMVPGQAKVVADDLDSVEIVPTSMAWDVKGACQQICLENVPYGASIEWWLEPVANLDPDDIQDCEEPWAGGVFDPANHSDDTCIIIKSYLRGGIHIYAKVCVTVPGTLASETECVTLHTQKNWGELDHTELDVDPDTDGVQHTETVTVSPVATEEIEETITDMVYAEFPEVPGTVPAGHAIVHWWLFQDTDENQEFIDDLMDYLAAHQGALDDDHWAAHGRYIVEDLDLGEPFDYINHYGLGPDLVSGTADDRFADPTIFSWNEIIPPPPADTGAIVFPWYAWNTTEDSLSGDVRGRARAVLIVDPTELDLCVEEKIMIVVLTSYPGSTTPQDDPFNGENIICLEKGKKQFTKTMATRNLSTIVKPGANFNVGIEAWGCGSTGQVTETLPFEFAYVVGSCTDPNIGVEVLANIVKFTFSGDAATFTYTVTASMVEGYYTFTGVVRDYDLNEFPVCGDDTIAVTHNRPPVADAGPDRLVYGGPAGTETAEVTLDGSGSYDQDGDPLTYTWTWDGNIAYGVSPTVELPVGTTTITLVVNDGELDSDPDTADITVGACFIATAAYGTSAAEEIEVLREFRDEVMLPNRVGAELVAFYYRVSPPLAAFISRHEVLRTVAREGFVEPLVVILRYSQGLWHR
ncbi:MAG: PKD domain-containing protein [Dehalococcoidia bacterium]|nr:PKD domain-containing protein [Dehalococcoidia bacterium]